VIPIRSTDPLVKINSSYIAGIKTVEITSKFNILAKYDW